MMSIWETILDEWRRKEFPPAFPREQEISTQKHDPVKKVTVITGFRRVGKTFVVYQTIQKLLKSRSKKDICYVNFEDERIPAETTVLTELIPAFTSYFGQKPKFLFLDEVQNIPLWSKYVRRILDNENIQIFLTGSSSKMSSFELPTELRGRSWEIKINPLTFGEFLNFKGEADPEIPRRQYLFTEYLKFGGLPEVVLLANEEIKLNTLQEYFRTTIRRDIMDRYRIKNEEPLKTTARLLFNSTYYTLSKIYRDIKSQGFKIGKSVLNNYLTYLESSYIFSPVYYFSPSMRNQLQHPRKAYFIDTGLISALSTKFSENLGRLLENLVYQNYQSAGREVYYYQNARKTDEVDFVVVEKGKVTELVQVCFDLSDEQTRRREIKSLYSAAKVFNCNRLSIVTAGVSEKVPEDITQIRLPANGATPGRSR